MQTHQQQNWDRGESEGECHLFGEHVTESQRSGKKDEDDVGNLVDVATNRKSLEMLESLAELEKSMTMLEAL